MKLILKGRYCALYEEVGHYLETRFVIRSNSNHSAWFVCHNRDEAIAHFNKVKNIQPKRVEHDLIF